MLLGKSSPIDKNIDDYESRLVTVEPVTRNAIRMLALVMLSGSLCVDATGKAVDFAKQSITVALTQEPPNLNTLRMTDLVSFFVISHTVEGLLRYDRRGNLAPGVATSWKHTDADITFKLRHDSRWSDGSPVTAHDFVFAWRQLNDPKVAAPYAAIMYPIRNAEAVQRGEKPVAALGVVALDDLTLRVELENPCGYCLALVAHGAFFPIKEEFYLKHGTKYASEHDYLLYNGPFKLTRWIHGAELTLKKNQDYWNKDAVGLNEIKVGYITNDSRTRLNLFRDGSIALARLDAETVRDAVEQRLKVKTFVTGGMSYLRFNIRDGKPMADRAIRKAIQSAFDSDEYVNKVIAIPGYKAARSFFPSWLNGTRDKFHKEYELGLKDEAVPTEEIIERGRRAAAHTGTVILLTVTSPTGVKVAEYIQGLLKNRLGLDVKIDHQTLKQYLAKSRNGDFDISINSWFPDFDDVMTYADLMASWNPNNRGGYASVEYDRWLAVLQGSVVAQERMDAAYELHKIIVRDAMVLPMAETGSAYLQHPALKGVLRRVVGGDPEYTFARVVELK